MIGTSILPEIIRAAILSTKVNAEGIMPVSLFVVAPFESGKTRLVMENSGEESLVITDLTGMGLLEALLMNQSATTVVVNDMSVVVGHRQSVNKLTISILNSLAEEGTFKIAVPKMAHLDLRGRRVNVIACCVPEVVADKRNWWYRSGFMSRLLTVRFGHSIALQLAIHKAIQNGDQRATERPASLSVPSIPVRVTIEAKESLEISSLSSRVFKVYSEMGYRKHKQMRALAAGHALLRSWKNAEVTKTDIEFIEKCIPFLLEGSQI